MTKKESSSDKEAGNEVVVVDTEDAVQFEDEGRAAAEQQESAAAEQESAAETEDAVQFEDESKAAVTEPEATAATDEKAAAETVEDKLVASDSAASDKPAAPTAPPPAPARRSWFGLFNFLLILALAGAAGYYWWLEQQVKTNYEATIAELRNEIAARASSARVEEVDGGLDAVRSDLGALKGEVENLGTTQQSLSEASEKLYELYGRDKNDWQLAEVEYLMRVAQHKLILQDDFEGAAVTLQAASDKIALTADPGLLPVRVLISEEIADLKTRKRPDLVGATLILAQLARQARVLQPGFERRSSDAAAAVPPPEAEAEGDLLDRVNRVVEQLVTIRYEGDRQPTAVEASIVNVGETLEDNLKLARWAVLDRDAAQYRELIDETLRLFREFYDLDDAANGDFLDQLLELQKMQLKPEKPDITGSLRELQRILSQRENAPAATEAGNG